jgi:sortase A
MFIEGKPKRGQPFASLRIPTIDRLKEGWNIVEGVKYRQLRKGAGHMPWTPLPGQRGNAVISGHRTTHGAPFHEFDELEPGDRIELETAIGVHVYEVRGVKIVKPNALWVTASDGPKRAGLENGDVGAWLTLTTCHPKFSARKRLIVFAEMVDGPNFDTISRLTG